MGVRIEGTDLIRSVPNRGICDLHLSGSGSWQDSTRQLRILRKSHGHNIPTTIFGFVEALVRDFEQLDGG
jgi:hypothetical protein